MPSMLEQVNLNNQEKEQSISEKLQMAVFNEMLSSKKIELKTDLTQRQINAITRGLLFSKRYNSKLMADLCTTQMKLLVSKGRKGRQEMTQMSQNLHSNEEVQKQSPLQKLF